MMLCSWSEDRWPLLHPSVPCWCVSILCWTSWLARWWIPSFPSLSRVWCWRHLLCWWCGNVLYFPANLDANPPSVEKQQFQNFCKYSDFLEYLQKFWNCCFSTEGGGLRLILLESRVPMPLGWKLHGPCCDWSEKWWEWSETVRLRPESLAKMWKRMPRIPAITAASDRIA